MVRNALGRGLGALIREAEPEPFRERHEVDQAPNSGTVASTVSQMSAQQLIDVDLIEPSPFQPRTHFREEALAELAQSIKTTGVIQPLVLRPIGSRFQLLAGERRWRASQRAGLTRVPAVIRDVTDAVALEITLVENIQREDLNSVEEARAFERLMIEFHLTQDEIAVRTGKNRTTVANAVRLLHLDRGILELIEDDRLTAGHGRALLAFTDAKVRMALARRASKGALTVRQIERLAARRNRAASTTTEEPQPLDANIRAALEQLQEALGTRVTLRPATKKRPGELVLEYYDDAQLTGLYDRLMR
jgi:ParB family transcriptional regulator, chromosome partitioning protein